MHRNRWTHAGRRVLALVAVVAAAIAVVGVAAPAGAATDDVIHRGVSPLGPYNVAIGPNGHVWFTASEENHIARIADDLTTLSTYSSNVFDGPFDLATDTAGIVWFTNSVADEIGRLVPGNPISITTYTDANVDDPTSIVNGPDGNRWFTSTASDRIGKITPAGVITTYPNANVDAPGNLTVGPDGNLWFVSRANQRIGKITTAGTITTYANAGITDPDQITAGPDGALWFSQSPPNPLGRITTAGSFSFMTPPRGGDYIGGLVTGADGNLWFASYENAGLHGGLIRMTTTGRFTRFADCTALATPYDLVSGPGGRIYFTTAHGIGRLTPAPLAAHCFTDVAPTSPYDQALKWARGAEVVGAAPNHPFHPNRAVTRAQAVSMVWQTGDHPEGSPAHGFPDAGPSAALNWAAANGVVAAYNDGTFRPGTAATRSQVVTMLWRLAGSPIGNPPHPFPDVPAGASYRQAVRWAVAHGIAAGLPDGKFHPRQAVTRGQIARMLFKLAGNQAAWSAYPPPFPSTVRF
jgi:streptogramin lyase